jgi:sterol desaturase/sphingolipid hydroxylase (fatty acid hydroxylase superfamily)
MAHARFALQAPPPGPRPRLAERLRVFFLQRWTGRLLLGALFLLLLDQGLGLPLPCGLGALYIVTLVVLCIVFLVRIGRYLVRRLLWRIRTKMIVTILFI